MRKIYDKPDQVLSDTHTQNKLIHEAPKQALGNGEVLITGDFNYMEIEWERLDPRGGRAMWRPQFSDRAKENLWNQHVTEQKRGEKFYTKLHSYIKV